MKDITKYLVYPGQNLLSLPMDSQLLQVANDGFGDELYVLADQDAPLGPMRTFEVVYPWDTIGDDFVYVDTWAKEDNEFSNGPTILFLFEQVDS